MLIKEVAVRGYVTFAVNANKSSRGRPSGGLLAAVKPNFEPKLVKKDTNYIIIDSNTAVFVHCYYNPTTEVAQICEQISELLNHISSSITTDKSIFIVGDFNCRIDNGSTKGIELVSFLESENFALVNKQSEHTYISNNGNSTIDLIFTNQARCISEINIEQVLVRKHQIVNVSVQIPHLKDNLKVAVQRKLDLNKLTYLKSKLNMTENAFASNLNNFNTRINLIIKNATVKKRKYFHKPWFDEECRELKSKCCSINRSNPEYHNLKKQYKKLINNKRTNYTEMRLIEKFDCKLLQWSLFKKKRPPATTNVPIETLQTHFNHLYTTDTVLHLQLNTNHDAWCDELFTRDEILKTIRDSKNGKATGPDSISNEQIKQSSVILETEWELLFNRCLLEGQIPSAWKDSTIYTLYKGKGNLADPNNYRGISLQQSGYKLLTKLINYRLITNLFDKLPEEQYGFIPGRSTTTPIQKLIDNTRSETSIKRGKMYACFIDFEKAFDSVDRQSLNQKLIHHFNLGGRLLVLINYILRYNNLYVTDGSQTSKKIRQTKGVEQGGSLSPTLFILYLADFPKEIKRGTNNLQISMYADDVVIYSNTTEEINIALENLAKYCVTNKLKVNLAKTQVVKFRNGGRLAKSDHFIYNNEEVKITNSYTYLGVTLRTKLAFTEHVKNRKLQAVRAINSLTNLHRLSVENAKTLFDQKIKPIATYALKQIAPLLNVNHYLELDKIKSYFIKRILGVHNSASSTLVHHMIGWYTFTEDLRNAYDFNNEEINKYKLIKEDKNWNFVAENYTDGPAFRTATWRKANQNNRSKICRTTVHGFHHNICNTTTKFHQITDNCICKYCSNFCNDRYHILKCNDAIQAVDVT